MDEKNDESKLYIFNFTALNWNSFIIIVGWKRFHGFDIPNTFPPSTHNCQHNASFKYEIVTKTISKPLKISCIQYTQ